MFLLTSLLDENDNPISQDKSKPQTKICVKNVLDTTVKNKNECKNIITSIINTKSPINNDIIDTNAYDDLEIFKGIDQSENSIFNSLDRTKTLCGRILFNNRINTPSTDINYLKKEQKILKGLLKNKQIVEKINTKLKDITELEDNILWILKDKSIEEQQILNNVFFSNRYLKPFNGQEEILTFYSLFKIIFAPVYGMLSPVIFVIIPFIYLNYFTKVKFDFKTYFKIFKMSIFGNFSMLGGGGGQSKTGISRYLSMILSFVIYVQNLVNSIQISKDTNNIINILHKKINDTNKFVKHVCELKELTKDILNFEDIKHHLPQINTELFERTPHLFSNKGKILTCYNLIQNKQKYNDLLNEIATIDYYNSIITLINEHENICFPTYIENENPIINAKELWHPYLSEPINNDILIGKKNPKNVLITGPNAGGKSTFIKSLAISVIFSQTIGIAFCNSLEITPFSLINTYLNIPDCKGKESLFEAEMHRARDHIRKLSDTDKTKFSFIVMDEIFNSTNPEEGISGAYAIAEKLAGFNNSLSIITTHFSYLTNLESGNKFKNYKIPIQRDSNDTIIYPYKIKPGISNQYIALELLRNKGFDNDLVDNAENICKNLSLNNLGNKFVKISKPKTKSKNEKLDLDTLTEPEDIITDVEFLEDTDNE
jgi:DNA mismatch repair protein MutS